MSESKIWSKPPDSLTLQGGEVHVWRIDLEQPVHLVEEFRKTLEPHEIDRANRFHFERHQRDFIVARGFLRYLVGRYLRTNAEAVRFSYGPYGKPALNDEDNDLRFNMSHSHGVAVYAFAENRQLGIDVEHIRADFASEDIEQRFFSAFEVESLCGLPAAERVAGFFRCWTRKEAYIKATGKGLSQSLDGFDVSLAPSVPAALLRASDDTVDRWSMFDVEVGEEHAGALVVEGEVSVIKYWEVVK
jgi:4'-phosphopantetheinyl transferase